MLCTDAGKTCRRRFGGADVSSGGVVGGGVLEQGHGLAAGVGYFVLDAVPATCGGGEGGGFLASGWGGKVVDDGTSIDPQSLGLEGLDPEGGSAGL